MENKTNIYVKYILAFFGLIILVAISYYGYYKFFKEEPQIPTDVLDELVDDDFNNLFNDEDNENNTGDNQEITYVENNCYIDDVVVESGKSIKLYSRKSVSPYEDCEDFTKNRVCDDGFLLGEDEYKFATCEADFDCELPDGSILKNGESVKLYSRQSVPYGETCERYATERTCKENILLGDDRFVYKTCKISYDNSCDVGNGKVLADNQTHLFYSKSTVPFNESCEDYSLRLMCSNGVIQGGDISEYPYWDCSQESAKDCYIDGTKIEHGFPVILYSRQYGTDTRTCDFYDELFSCNNGSLENVDGDYTIEEYHYVNCYDN